MADLSSYRFEKQLSVVLENVPGALADICSAFAKHNVNILALSIVDMIDTGELRLVVSNPEKAKEILGLLEHDYLESEVLAVEMYHKPGILAEVADRLAKAKINIEYAYGSAGNINGKVMSILKVSDTGRASEILGC